MPQRSFSVQVDNFIAKSRRRRTAVLRTAAQMVVKEMQTPIAKGGRLPVDTGFLKNSLVTELDGGAPIATPGTDAEGGRGDSYVLGIAGLDWGKSILFGYTANYARYQEYGTSRQQPRAFVSGAARKWRGYVRQAANRARTIR